MFKDKTEAFVVGTKIQRIKAHLQENKNAYLAAGGGVAVGTLGMFLLKQNPLQVVNTINNTPVFNNDNSSIVNFGGHMTKMVERTSDGKIWKSVTEAAADEGYELTRMSRHLNGHIPHINGVKYRIAGMGTTG